MIRYALFGTDALRAEGAQYKDLNVTLEFKDFKVVRKPGKAQLLTGDKVIATGVTPVNAKIKQILGFDLKVFDIACSANQGDIEALSNTKPAERKRMVDQTIGLQFLDELTKWVGEQAKDARVRADNLRDSLVAPIEPIMPEGYEPSFQLNDRLTGLRADVAEYNQLKGWLQNDRQSPATPVCEVFEIAEELEEVVAEFEAQARLRRELAGLLPPPEMDPAEAEAKLEAWELRCEHENFCERYAPDFHYTQDELNGFIHDWFVIGLFEKKTECPSCGHQWVGDVDLTGQTRPETPPISEAEALREEKRWEHWLSPPVQARWAELKDAKPTTKPTFTRQDISRWWKAQQDQDRRHQIEAALKEVPDRRADLTKRRNYEAALVAYERQLGEYIEWAKTRVEKQTRLKALDNSPHLLTELEEFHAACVRYETLMDMYDTALQAYDTQTQKIKAFEDLNEEWGRAKKAIEDVRLKVKAHLVPSLNKVASQLLSEMTNGTRNKVVVSDDFDIAIDGQPLHTLSGSAKAVANLAIRIALGQVLTNRQLSIFLGDEIDESMDQERADATTACIRRLTKHIKQIILVTHKNLDVDTKIELAL